MKLEYTYHWTSIENKDNILREGIKILSREEEYQNPVSNKKEIWSTPYICTSLDPYKALTYVTPEFNDREIEEGCLFQIQLSDNDSIKIRCDNSRDIIEVRIFNSIPADRVRFIGVRDIDYE